jgi:hypothetical protein
MRLKIDRIARPYEGCHISDGVGDHELATQAAGDVQRLVKITRTVRIDGDQFQICAVKIGKPRLGDAVQVGIHTHDDAGCGVANSLVAVEAGARLVQGTMNGYGERCGNANLVSILPALQRHIRPEALSRVSAYDWFGSLAAVPVGMLIWGPIADQSSDRLGPWLGHEHRAQWVGRLEERLECEPALDHELAVASRHREHILRIIGRLRSSLAFARCCSI